MPVEAGCGWNNGEPVAGGPCPNNEGPLVAVALVAPAADEAPRDWPNIFVVPVEETAEGFWPKRDEPTVAAGFDWNSGGLEAAAVGCWPKIEPEAVVVAEDDAEAAAGDACPKMLVLEPAGFA